MLELSTACNESSTSLYALVAVLTTQRKNERADSIEERRRKVKDSTPPNSLSREIEIRSRESTAVHLKYRTPHVQLAPLPEMCAAPFWRLLSL
jgi:hypothetical protein